MNIEAYFKLTYGLYVISVANQKKKNGYIANTAFQVTAQPAQLSISCSKDNFSCAMIESSGYFSLSVLKQEANADLIGAFGYNSGKDINKFETVAHFETANNTPVVTEDVIAWFECRVIKKVDLGSHLLFIAEIVDNDLLEKDAIPLTYAYYHEVKRGLAPKNAPTYIDKSKLTEEEPTETESGEKHRCLVCSYVYDSLVGDETTGVKPGTTFDELPANWTCPTCGATKEMFELIDY